MLYIIQLRCLDAMAYPMPGLPMCIYVPTASIVKVEDSRQGRHFLAPLPCLTELETASTGSNIDAVLG